MPWLQILMLVVQVLSWFLSRIQKQIQRRNRNSSEHELVDDAVRLVGHLRLGLQKLREHRKARRA